MIAGEAPDERAVREGCRLLEGEAGITVTGPLRWWDRQRYWSLSLRLTVEAGAPSEVAATSDWYAVVSERYPFGRIEIFPARAGGLEGTRPHQDRNSPGDGSLPWTEGDICVKTPAFVHGRHGDDPDPLGKIDRLRWYCQRALSWLQDARAGTLMREGDHFELPKFAALADTVGFCEDETTFNVWTGSPARYGVAELVRLNGNARAVRRFTDPGGRLIVRSGWGTAISESKDTEPAAWIRLDRLPILEPYEAPGTWAELWRAIERIGAAPEDLFRPALTPIRDGKSHILLVGFPIPARVAEAPTVLHWQPLMLPDSVTSRKAPPGFRNNDQGLWTRDLTLVLRGGKPLSWLTGENWAIDRLGARGRLPESIRNASVTLVGAGSLGSAVAELLVRGGVYDLHIVDPERLTAGNLVRHTLTLRDVAQHKAEWLARRLNGVSPFARARFSNRDANAEGSSGHVGPRIVLDCTGSDDVLQQLSAGPAEPGTLLVSLSIGLGARHLYALAAPGRVFDFRMFQAAVQPWLRQDLEDQGPGPLPQEGPGCWHPLFPARQDEVAMHAAAAVQRLVKWAAVPPAEWTLSVLERSVSEAGEVIYGPGRHAER